MEFRDVLEKIKTINLHIVYNYSNNPDAYKTRYDQWGASVIFFYGMAAEILGLNPRYLDIDTYLSEFSRPRLFEPCTVVNLHSGVSRIASWPMIGSLAAWHAVPVVPCAADVHVTGERKDVAKALAAEQGFNVPKPFSPETDEHRHIVKPRSLGMSEGIYVTSDRADLAAKSQDQDYVVQAFVPGYDATVAVIAHPDRGLWVTDALLFVPASGDLDWYPSKAFKIQDRMPAGSNASGPCPEVQGHRVDVAAPLAQRIRTLCRAIGPSSVYRLDFRIAPEDDGGVPDQLTPGNTHFLEINPTPTVSWHTDAGKLLRAALGPAQPASSCFQDTDLDRPDEALFPARVLALQLFEALARDH